MPGILLVMNSQLSRDWQIKQERNHKKTSSTKFYGSDKDKQGSAVSAEL